MRVQSHGLDGLEAEINFLSNGWRRDTCNRIQGKVYNRATGQVYYKLSGTWNGFIMATRMNSNGEDAESFLVWKRSETPPGSEIMYNFSSFAMKLNELTGPLKEALCGTDSRLRPDQRAMEEGEFELASKLKVKLEEKQRRARKLTEHQERKPRWFHQCTEKDTNQNHWQFTGNYWQDRKLKNWTEIPDIFL
jgi:oxysterol-binding protein 1